ncbi:hypothetical protein J6590_099784 [Homalodisca vitripennis]|nr:hypothetical protein J6590_099784 [Homalodisca vitripennis]
MKGLLFRTRLFSKSQWISGVCSAESAVQATSSRYLILFTPLNSLTYCSCLLRGPGSASKQEQGYRNYLSLIMLQRNTSNINDFLIVDERLVIDVKNV